MRKRFYVIDGHAHIFRAYFAPFRDLTSPTGEPTKATYVFIQMLFNLIEQQKPDYLAMVIDSGGDEGVFRKAIYPEYKANRKERPADFEPQEQRIIQLVKEAGVPIYGIPGFEADDLIATIAHQLCGTDYELVIVSKDKDLRQLISDCVQMYDVQADVFLDDKSMVEKHGYTPAQAVEIQTLIGDPTDNVPGIPGVGEKTAIKLVNKYGSADGVLAHLDEQTPKLRENLQQFGHLLALSRQLVTLKPDVAFDFDPQACLFKGLNAEALRPLLLELGFATLAKKLPGGDVTPQPQPAAGELFTGTRSGGRPAKKSAEPEGPGLFDGTGAAGDHAPVDDAHTSANADYRCVRSADELEAFATELARQTRFALDTETDDLGAMKSNLVGLSFSWQEGAGWYIPVRGPAGEAVLDQQVVLDRLRPILTDPAIRKVGHNLKYDLLALRKAGVRVAGVEMDTMIAAFLLDASRLQYGLDRIAMEVLNFRKIPTESLIGKGRNQRRMDQVAIDQVTTYAAEDADIAWRLATFFTDRLDTNPSLRKLHDEVETPLVEALVEMEFNGIAVDPAVLQEQSRVLGERVDELRTRIMQEAGREFNPDSPKQLGEVLFTTLGLKVVKRTKTGPSTDVEVLEKLADLHPVPKLILEYRQLVKLKNTYLDSLGDYINVQTHRIHASFNQIGAATGRLSCNDPNLQNIPIRTDEGRRIRLAFVPGDRARNVLMTADYSQIELRVLAHLTQEPALVAAFENDEDIHQTVAAEVFGVPLAEVSREQRSQAKTVNFGIIYGVTAFGLARRIGELSVGAAQELINAYNRRFPSIQKFMDQCVMEAQTNGYVETILGRRRPIFDIHSGVVAQRQAAERVAINSVVQGSAADMIKVAMLNIHRRLQAENRPSKMLLQVHDELVFETPADAVEAESAMVREEMIGAMPLRVPLKVDIGFGKNWEEGK